jgi:imidazolonepropionase-like amidohydrolase
VLACLLAGLGCGDGIGPELEFPDQPAPDPQPPVVAFTDVRVVSPLLGRSVDEQTVLVRDGKIEVVGPVESVSIPEGAFVVEGFGRYLMSGLTDMHVHITEDTFEELRNDYLVYLANGVTTLRIMWGFRTMVSERDSIDAGALLGPDLFVASPGLDGPGGPWAESTAPVATVAEARQTVADYAAVGYDFIKVYNLLAPEVYDAIVAEAALHGVPLVGHVPGRVGIERVQSAGQVTSEHFIGLKLAASTGFTAGTITVSRVRELLTRSAELGLWHTPTITVDALSREERDGIRAGDQLGFIAPGVREFFESGFHHGLAGETASRERDNHELMIREVRRAGAGLLVGTDAGFGWMLPGFSIHDELEGIIAAGLEPAEVLTAATVNAAAALGVPGEMGQVLPGFRADLVLVPGDPLRDVRAIRDHDGVMVRGRWLSRGTLDRWLEEIRAGYGS